VGPPTDGLPFADAFAADLDPRVGEVYAHSELTLYRFNPVAGDFVTVGEFGCLKGGDGVALMLDIAIDRAGQHGRHRGDVRTRRDQRDGWSRSTR
jgi:hypothetical protein